MKIGIIGGSGLDNPQILSDFKEKNIETKYGSPSSSITCGKIKGVDVCILARHGKDHSIPPHKINYQANIAALKMLGCDCILATSAVGSLKEKIKPGHLIFPNQFIDFTKQRKSTFYDEVGEVRHTEMAEPFSKDLRRVLIRNAEELGFEKHDWATIVVIDGPRFSTRSESFMFKRLGADIIGMTMVPECSLAKEAGIPYASIAMSTDYDCWKKEEKPVTFEIVLETMRKNAEKVIKLLLKTIPIIANQDEEFIKSKIRTIPNFPKPGIMFRDITTLLSDREGFDRTINVFYNKYKRNPIDVVAGIESRGFIFGSALAHKLGVGFVPIRKPGKLPGEVISEEYELEYGKDSVEIHKDSIKKGAKVLLIDDLIATGGTAYAACNLIEKLGGEIIGCGFVVNLPDLGGKDKLVKWPVYSILEFKGE